MPRTHRRLRRRSRNRLPLGDSDTSVAEVPPFAPSRPSAAAVSPSPPSSPRGASRVFPVRPPAPAASPAPASGAASSCGAPPAAADEEDPPADASSDPLDRARLSRIRQAKRDAENSSLWMPPSEPIEHRFLTSLGVARNVLRSLFLDDLLPLILNTLLQSSRILLTALKVSLN